MNSSDRLEENLRKARDLLEEACSKSVSLVAFPENFLLFTDQSKVLRKHAEESMHWVVETLQEWSAEYDVWILAGSLPLQGRTKGKTTNSSLVFSPDGSLHARYDKIHLFDVVVSGDQKYAESDAVEAGKKVVVTDIEWAKLGLSICFDLRFPELYRKLATKGAEVLMIPSAFTAVTGAAHWDTLTRARAIENQVFVVAPAQVGSAFPGRVTHGHTRIVDPWGRVIAERPKGEGVVWADLDPGLQTKLRTDMPVLELRR
jgi:nitrilase